jgi:hypothetical protein
LKKDKIIYYYLKSYPAPVHRNFVLDLLSSKQTECECFHILRRAFKDSDSEEEEAAAGTEITTRHGAQTTTAFKTVFSRTAFLSLAIYKSKDAQA